MCSQMDDPSQHQPEPLPLPEDHPTRTAWVYKIARPSLRDGETLPFIKPTAEFSTRKISQIDPFTPEELAQIQRQSQSD